MNKLTLPKNLHKGLKVFCRQCNEDNSKCRHYDNQVYRVRIHVPGSKNTVKTKVIAAKEYDDAVIEAIAFKKELSANDFTTIENKLDEDADIDEGNDYSIFDALIKYNQYLEGASSYAHLKKNVSKAYKDELIRFCTYFCQNVSKTKNIKTGRIKSISRVDVSNFYLWAERHYADKTFNKCMAGVKCFFEFLIDIEEIDMRNPFRKYITKEVIKSNIETVNRDEFLDILAAIDKFDPVVTLGGKGEPKNMYKPYLRDGFRLFLLTGGRREEVVNLR